jgi:two-component system, cell cycle sensor histidine kinase and response regulator CckA
MVGLRRVLLVDDNDIVRDLTRAMLEREGYEVLDAPDAARALDLVADPARVDLLVTDVLMPGIDGIELADQVLDLHPEAGVLFTSGHVDDRILAPGTVPAGAAFLPKPFTMAELAGTARDLVTAARGRSAPGAAAAFA